MKLTGIISEILPERSGISQRSGQEWKQFPFIFDFYDDDNQRYADRILLETWSTTDLATIKQAHENQLKVTLKIGHGVRRTDDGRAFNDLRLYNVELEEGQAPAPSQAAVAQAPTQATAAPATEAPTQGAQPDKLPF